MLLACVDKVHARRLCTDADPTLSTRRMTLLPSNRSPVALGAALVCLTAGCLPALVRDGEPWWTQPDYRVLGPAVAILAVAMLVRLFRRR